MRSLQGVTPAGPTCTCGSQGPHSIECLVTAWSQPNAMVNDQGEVFYPGDEQDADWFAREHGARWLHPTTAAFLGGTT